VKKAILWVFKNRADYKTQKTQYEKADKKPKEKMDRNIQRLEERNVVNGFRYDQVKQASYSKNQSAYPSYNKIEFSIAFNLVDNPKVINKNQNQCNDHG
jgi:hypothetical protein